MSSRQEILNNDLTHRNLVSEAQQIINIDLNFNRYIFVYIFYQHIRILTAIIEKSCYCNIYIGK